MADKFKACSVSGCNGNASRTKFGAKGFCRMHYGMLRRHGDPLGGRPNGDLMRFVHETALPYGGKDCLIWPYGKKGSGYGQIRVNGKQRMAHRYVCISAHGEPPTLKHEAAHSCGNRSCVNPNHLSWKTRSSNQADRVIHGTHRRGERNKLAKLTEEQAIEIISLKEIVSKRSLAKKFGVSATTIAQIHNGQRWGWLTEALAKSRVVC